MAIGDLSSVQVRVGSKRHGLTGLLIGGVIGTVVGLVMVPKISDNPEDDYVSGTASFAVPLALLGWGIGRARQTDVWELVYRTPSG